MPARKTVFAVGGLVGIAFALGALASVFPSEHPRGLVGIWVDSLRDAGNLSRFSDTTSTAQPIESERELSGDGPVEQQFDEDEVSTVTEILSSKRSEWTIARTPVPGAKEYWANEQKPVGYLAVDQELDRLFFSTGSGVIMEYDPGQQTFREISSNLDEILPPEVRKPGKFSVKGFEVRRGTFYLSASNSRVDSDGETCWSTDLLSAQYSENSPLRFDHFYSPSGCVASSTWPELNPHQAGGAILIDGDAVLFGTGEYRARPLAQDPGSGLGSLVSISSSDPQDTKLLAIGLRNPQSIAKVPGGFYLTDQGPRGGDEINFVEVQGARNRLPLNFGWPEVSYGIHYDGTFKESAPLYRPHDYYGFVEPSYFFSASIGISSIAPSSESLLMVGGLGDPEDAVEGDASVSIFKVEQDNNLVLLDRVEIGARVRDVEPAPNSCWWLVLDDAEIAELCANRPLADR